ncbi:MAG: hypothetical protein IJ243_09735, partial [Prevotella sp.]|nr:hypothetical protein [Prevotella sp.]
MISAAKILFFCRKENIIEEKVASKQKKMPLTCCIKIILHTFVAKIIHFLLSTNEKKSSFDDCHAGFSAARLGAETSHWR